MLDFTKSAELHASGYLTVFARISRRKYAAKCCNIWLSDGQNKIQNSWEICDFTRKSAKGYRHA